MAEECKKAGWCHTGDAVATMGYLLKAPYCIHAVGPVWRGGDHGEAILLKDAYQSALRLADLAGAEEVAFPLISAGIYGYPLVDACYIAIKSILDYPTAGSISILGMTSIETVYIVVMDVRIEATLKQLLRTFNFDRG
jgi:O-acetyl-ADP-ribose deacetylase (regulator of RNase III)